MRAGAELDEILAILLRMRQSHEAWNAKVMGDVEHPELAPGFRKLASQLSDIGVVELTDIQFRPLQFVVPPDGVGIPLHQLQKALDNGFLEGVARGAAVGIGMDLAGALIEEI